MTQKWAIMVWLTWNPATARHAASADQSNALLQSLLPTKLSMTVATVYIERDNRIHWQQSAGLLRSQYWRPPAVAAPPSQRWWHPEEGREARSGRQSPKAKTEAVKDFEAWSPKLPPNLNRSQKCSSRTEASVGCVETGSANRSPKCASKPEALL